MPGRSSSDMLGILNQSTSIALTVDQRRRLMRYSREAVTHAADEDEDKDSAGSKPLKDMAVQRAVRLLLDAATEHGHTDAQCSLGQVFEETNNISDAVQW